MNWNVYVTLRDPAGEVRRELMGSCHQSELAPVLEAAMIRAGRERGGVWVSRDTNGGPPPIGHG
jgi:hypothetical protein